MTNSTKYSAEFWDGMRAERLAAERVEDEARRDLARDLERKAVEAEATLRIQRYIAKADEAVAQHHAETAGINQAYYRGKAEGLEIALAILRGVVTDRSAR